MVRTPCPPPLQRTHWRVHEILVLISYEQKTPINDHDSVSSEAKGINFGLSLHLHPFFVINCENISCQKNEITLVNVNAPEVPTTHFISSPTPLLNSIKHEHSCKILYLLKCCMYALYVQCINNVHYDTENKENCLHVPTTISTAN